MGVSRTQQGLLHGSIAWTMDLCTYGMTTAQGSHDGVRGDASLWSSQPLVSLNRHFPRTGSVWGGDTNHAVLLKKDTWPQQFSPAWLSLDTPTRPHQAQGSSLDSLFFC